MSWLALLRYLSRTVHNDFSCPWALTTLRHHLVDYRDIICFSRRILLSGLFLHLG